MPDLKPWLDPAARARLMDAYALPSAQPDAGEWDALIARAETDDTPVTVIEIASLQRDERARHDAYLAAITAASAGVDGTLVAICDILEPGTGDLLPYLGYAGGVATLLAFPSRAAFLAAILSDAWQAGLAARRAAVRDAIVLVAGENGIPPLARAMLGTPPGNGFPDPEHRGQVA